MLYCKTHGWFSFGDTCPRCITIVSAPTNDETIPITQRTYSEQEMQEKDLIIQGIEEGAENWKAEYDNCRAILQLLVELKRVKDTEGKTEFYEKNQPITWEAAKRFLEKYTHL